MNSVTPATGNIIVNIARPINFQFRFKSENTTMPNVILNINKVAVSKFITKVSKFCANISGVEKRLINNIGPNDIKRAGRSFVIGKIIINNMKYFFIIIMSCSFLKS